MNRAKPTARSEQPTSTYDLSISAVAAGRPQEEEEEQESKMVPAEHATDDDDSSDELGKSLSPCLPLIVFQHHQSYQHENEHGMLMFSVSQKRLEVHLGP